MRWRGQRESRNVEDRRGMRVGGRGVAVGGVGVLLVIAFAFFTGQDPTVLLEQLAGGGPPVATDSRQAGSEGPPTDELGQFSAVVLASTEDVWEQTFASAGKQYQPPTLVLFSDAVQSACGFGSAAAGPFYCPADSKVYLDLAFFSELERRFGAPGDFAQAYVIAHEVGHHVQNQLGIAAKVRAAQSRLPTAEANQLSVRMELQADCLAGVWAYHANRNVQLLEPGDIEEGMTAAAAIGDDRIQKRTQGYTVPESWTHGSSAMRVQWLRAGMQSGDINACDTFGRENP